MFDQMFSRRERKIKRRRGAFFGLYFSGLLAQDDQLKRGQISLEGLTQL